ncbi:phage antirepressor KilAC domain-containing protein [Arthrobacter cavernae]|uniref:Phage antirepressor KilAC domain-containing protein n=1 Tax=Arthrobacter cavernae TaxID=2817681 RepID=A0A939HHZ4_9MICC|nr:phage antirepressor KilAC domain-containing protein [Arthrobacter cavernae]MBO1269599.1 phage antirepressor KilAC domain-containing protein [Arthrobacter cavernae]
MNNLDIFTQAASPFDSLRQLRADGSEFWSARDLAPFMTYSSWRNFMVPMERAMATARNQGHDVETNFAGSRKVSASGPDKQDFHLSRFAAYLVAMNGDPRKPEVAAAQAYFAIQTRVAETTAPIRELTFEEKMLDVMGTLQARVDDQRRQLADTCERLAAVAPKVEAYDALIDASGLLSMQAAAKALGFGPNILFRDLRRLGILQRNNLPFQRYLHHFDVKLGSYRNRAGETIPTATTMVRPAGLDFLRRKLAKAAVEATSQAVGSLVRSGGPAHDH